MKIKNVLVMYLTQTYYIVNILRSLYTLVIVQRKTRGTRYCQLHMQSINNSTFITMRITISEVPLLHFKTQAFQNQIFSVAVASVHELSSERTFASCLRSARVATRLATKKNFSFIFMQRCTSDIVIRIVLLLLCVNYY